MTLLQQYVEIGSLDRFITEAIGIINDELQEKTQWEFYLHKVYEKSFAEFLREIEGSDGDQAGTADMDEIETTVKRSLQVLDLFNGQ